MNDKINDGLLRQILGAEKSVAAPACSIGTEKPKSWGLVGYPLSMVYSPIQDFKEIYDMDSALMQGTIFKELDLPFMGMTVSGGGCLRG